MYHPFASLTCLVFHYRYSWGACLAAHAAQLENVTAYIGISPVTGMLCDMQHSLLAPIYHAMLSVFLHWVTLTLHCCMSAQQLSLCIDDSLSACAWPINTNCGLQVG